MDVALDPFSAYLAGLPAQWQRAACRKVIATVRAAGAFEEHIKWNNPYFAVQGAAAIKLFCAAGWMNVYFYRGRELADPANLFDPDTNSSMRKIRIHESTVIDRAALLRLIVQAHALHWPIPVVASRGV